MAQITALLNSAHTHLQQIRVFITNTKSALTHLLSKAESSDNEVRDDFNSGIVVATGGFIPQSV